MEQGDQRGRRRAGEVVWPNDDAGSEPAIKVLMDRDRVVVRPVGHLDPGSVETILDLLDRAREAGVNAVVDLDAIEPGDLAGDVLARLVAADSSSSLSRY
jgi:hypothetical protein